MLKDYSIFLVVLGGRCNEANIELHDVRWVVGSKIEDTFQELKSQWFGDKNSIHIDSYIKINYIEGFKIVCTKKDSSNINPLAGKDKKHLWFVNFGGYKDNSMFELHQFDLFIASSSTEAVKKARNKLLLGTKKRHKDDISDFCKNETIDDIHKLNNFNGWEISIIKDPYKRSQVIKPDWFGYLKL